MSKHKSNKIYQIIIYFLGFFFIGLALWTSKFFGQVTVDQALSTFYFNWQGSLAGDPKFTKRFIEWCIFWPAVLTTLIQLLPTIFKLIHKLHQSIQRSTASQHLIRTYLPLIILGSGIMLTANQYSIGDYLRYHFTQSSDFFANNYISPEKVTLTAKHPKSLLLIYVESLESTYANTNIFDRDLLQRLNRLQTNHINFNQYEQVPGTGWSIAGIIGTQCALPLKLISMQDTNRFTESVNHFLPSATCLSDILAKYGYKNIYMNGSDVDFAGVGNFFKEHHYSELYGKNNWLAEGVLKFDDSTGWGLPDDLLLQQAKIKLAKLIEADQPFNLTLFTIDTHGISGQLSKTCAQKGYSDFEGIVECTSNMIADLISYADQHGWLDKMDIVVVGDHLAMKNLASRELNKSKHHYIYNMIVSKDKLQKNREEIVHFDMLPTILTALGFQVEGGHMGLGYSAIGKNTAPLPANRIATLKNEIPYPSDAYTKLWQTK